jgi:hypothetical protein
MYDLRWMLAPWRDGGWAWTVRRWEDGRWRVVYRAMDRASAQRHLNWLAAPNTGGSR